MTNAKRLSMSAGWPAGRTIVRSRAMKPEEMGAYGWDGHPPVVLELDDGSRIFPSCDDEGNQPGTLFTIDGRGEHGGLVVKVTERGASGGGHAR